MVVKDYKNVALLLVFLLWGMAGTASAFYLNGTTYNETKGVLGGVNVSVEVYTFGPQGPQLIAVNSTTSNTTTGIFNLSVLDNSSYFFKPVVRHFNSGILDYIGQSLPELPYGEMLSISPMDFYLRPGGTINITATNGTAPQSFRYMIKDTRLGYPVASNFSVEVSSATIYVPANRSYSIELYPNQSFPVSYDLNNLTNYTNYYANITFNTSNTLRRVSGYANLSDGSSNFSNLKIVAYLLEPGSMVFQDYPLPYNMSAWNNPPQSDIYNATNGTYNITLPGAAMTANLLLFAAAYNSTTTTYYGAFRNISLNYSLNAVTNFNFTLQPLLGTVTNITLNNASGPGTTNVTTKKLTFQLQNGTTSNITGFAHVEVRVNYSAYNSSAFTWMVDVSQSNNGTFRIPALDAAISKINVFTQDFAPQKTSKTAAQLAEPVRINLTRFNNKKPDGNEFSGSVFIDMLKSTSDCDVPYPASGCSLFPDSGEMNDSAFNPFKIVLGGGKISLRMRLLSNNITVHYKNVDMLASGPPDALFDDSVNQSTQSGSALEQAWRFGSMGPEIYDEVLIGIPLSATARTDNVSVKLGKLYDDSWGTAWNITVNSTADIPSDYSTFNTTWFNTTTGMPCSTTNETAECYVNITNRMVWLRIPHFSGVGPTVVSSVVGNVTVNLTNSTGIAGRNVVMNFTVNDTVNATSFYNITFPGGFNASLAVVNITINGTVDPANWNKTTGALFVNVSRNGTHAATANVVQYINLSNVTIPSATGNHTINVTTNNTITVSVNYTVVAYNASLTNVSGYALTNNTTAGTNATYYLNLTNNGTATDSYTITVANPDNAYYYATNISTVTLDAGQTSVFTLNVTNTTASTVRVNVTATSVNDSTRFSYINTTTNVTGTVYGASLTLVTTASQTTNAGVNASYTLTLLNNNTLGLADTYNFTVANPDSASIFALNFTGNITLNASATRTIILNVTNTSSGVFRVNVTVRSNNDSTKYSYINTTTTVPVVITIASPANESTNTTGYVNVTATLDAAGLAQYLNWQGTNYSMTPNTSQSAGTVFYRNMTGLLSGNYSFRIYANDSNASNASEARIITVNRTNTTSLAANISLTTFIVNTTINITSPSGNVTVTIPNNTNASVSGAALTNVSIDSLAYVNSTFAAISSSDRFIGENLTLGPDGAQFSPDIQLNFSYTDAQLTAAGITDESSLSVKFYNTTTSQWVAQTTYSRNTTGNYIIVNVSHFSTFALLGTTTTTTPTGGGSSGSTGGGGVISSEPFANILKAESYDRNLIANSPVAYIFKASEHAIYEVVVTGSVSENDIALRCEALKGVSKLVTTPPPGVAYLNENVWLGTKRIKEATIKFKVKNTWLDSNGFATSEVKMVRWDGTQWIHLATTEKTKDATFTYYEAKTDSFSSLAVVGIKAAVPTATPAVQVTETAAPTATATPAPTAAPTEKAPGFELVLAAVTVCAAYLLGRKRR